MKKIEIDMFQEYVGKLIFRCCVFLAVLLAYLFDPDQKGRDAVAAFRTFVGADPADARSV